MSSTPAKALKSIRTLMSQDEQKSPIELDALYQKTLSPHKAHLLEAFQSWAPPALDMLNEDQWDARLRHPFVLILVVAELTKTSPEWFFDYLELLVNLTKDFAFSRAKAALGTLPQDRLVQAIRQDWNRADWDDNICLGLLDLVEDDETTKAIILDAMAYTGADFRFTNAQGHKAIRSASSASSLAPLLCLSGEAIVPIVRDTWRADMGPGEAALLVRVLEEFHSPDNADVLVQLLGIKSKYALPAAKELLVKLGEAAIPALTKGLKAKKKQAKTFCKSQLNELEKGNIYEPNSFEILPRDERLAMIQRAKDEFEIGYKDGKKWTKFLKNTVAKEPETWLIAILVAFGDNGHGQWMWKFLLELLRHKDMESSQENLWRIYVRELSQVDFDNNHTEWHLIKHIEGMPYELRDKIYPDTILGAEGSLMVRILGHYFQSGMCAPALLVQGLTHKSKKVREAAASGARHFEGDDAAVVVSLLKERKKATRLYTAMALQKMSDALVEPHRATIEAYRDGEADDEIKEVLTKVLAED